MSLPASMPAGMSAAQMVDYKPVMSGMDAMDGMAGMGVEGEGFSGSASLGPLPPALRRGLPAVAFFGFLSFFLSVALLILLVWKIHRWRAKGSHPLNQFTVLILCLLVADIQQSLAFLLNVQWVTQDMIDVSSPTCWAQGWFVSTGDLASGVWCFAIGIHTLASVLFNFRLSRPLFYTTIALLWGLVYFCAILSVGIHPTNIFVRAGAWCWVNDQFSNIRLYLHYVWIFTAELGVIIIYATILLVLSVRIRSGFYSHAIASRAKSVALLMAVYPAVYVVCTLPLASARMAAMAGRDVSLTHLVVAGAMITSNGWLDVILYALTRKILIFSDDPPPEDCGIGTFQLPWECPSRFGTFTFITADCEKGSKASSILKSMSLSRKNSKASSVDSVASTAIQIQVSSVENETGEEFVGCTAPSGSFSGPSRSIANYSRRSLKGQHREMFSGHAPSLSSEHSVRAETTVHVTNTPMDAEDLKEMKQAEKKEEDVMHSTLNEEDMNLDFETKPAGL